MVDPTRQSDARRSHLHETYAVVYGPAGQWPTGIRVGRRLHTDDYAPGFVRFAAA